MVPRNVRKPALELVTFVFVVVAHPSLVGYSRHTTLTGTSPMMSGGTFYRFAKSVTFNSKRKWIPMCHGFWSILLG